MIKYAVLIFLTVSMRSVAQQDSLRIQNIKEVQLKNDRLPKMQVEKGKYVFALGGTSFQDQTDIWEGFKVIPLLNVRDQEGISVFNKKVQIEINGVLIPMAPDELENYLRSLDPDLVRKIEITTTPNSSYGSEAQAVVNIILASKVDNYKIAITSNNGIRTKLMTQDRVNTAMNYNNLNAYLNYNFVFSQPVTALAMNYSLNNDENHTGAITESKNQAHTVLSNLQWELGAKTRLVFLQDFSFNEQAKKLNMKDSSGSLPSWEMHTGRNLIKFAQVFTHKFSEKHALKMGGQEIFSNQDYQNFTRGQKVKTPAPIISFYSDYTAENALGETLLGGKYTTVQTTNTHSREIAKRHVFQYSESTFASYVNHTMPVAEDVYLAAGLRYEYTTTNINNDGTTILDDQKHYALYNVTYQHLKPENESGQTFSFRKMLQRPNYQYIDPYIVNKEVLGFAGNTQILPSKYYVASWEYFKGQFAFSLQGSYVKDFLSTYYKMQDRQLIMTYQNFNHLYLGSITAAYNRDWFAFWNMSLNGELIGMLLKDPQYNEVIRSSTPSVNIKIANRFKLNKNTAFNLNYYTVSKYTDGLITHGSTHKLDLLLIKKFKNLDFTLYAYDILRGMRERDFIEGKIFAVASDEYLDRRVIGLQLRWNIVSKNFKPAKIIEITDDAINRL